MKRWLLGGSILLLSLLFLASVGMFRNQPYSLKIDENEVSAVELEKNGVTARVTDDESIGAIVTNMNSLQLQSVHQTSLGYLYRLRFYGLQDEELLNVTVNSEKRLYGRQVIEGKIDLEMLNRIYMLNENS